ncbi:MAG: excinuclease ABC subunit UvrC [Chloroflexota bacterium]
MDIADQLKLLPDKPGVYLMKNKSGEIIYIGKAVSLKNRVRSYFQSSRNHSPKTIAMVAQIDSFEFITTDNEVEALILESNLIKKHKPWYNIRIRDDKHYPYLRVSLNEDFPRITIARRVVKDGARYFGPYPNASAVRETIELARRLFPYRSCASIEGKPRPCLNYQIRRCLAPCQGYVSREDYGAMIKDLMLFIEGRTDDLLPAMQRDMEQAAERLDFERAAKLRDQIRAINEVVEKQKVLSTDLEDQDVAAFVRAGDEATAQFFHIRGGKLIGRHTYVLSGIEEQGDDEIADALLQQHYEEADFVPRDIYLSAEPASRQLIEQWLATKRGRPVHLHVPQRGEKAGLVKMALDNAELARKERLAERAVELETSETAGEQLAAALGLGEAPRRIECFDISNIQGTEAVGSMVVFAGGKPKKEDYRRFKIKTVLGPNDFAMMQEVLRRRFGRGLKEREEISAAGGLRRDEARFADFPDLLIVDGGKGQLSSAREVMRELGVEHIPTAGLAKENEWLYVEGRPDPIVLPRDSQALYLVQRIRDEAHRFAITYHRDLRKKRTLRSSLDDIAGIGPVRRTSLLKHFGSIARIRAASLEDLLAVAGMDRRAAEAVYQHFQQLAKDKPGADGTAPPAAGEKGSDSDDRPE